MSTADPIMACMGAYFAKKETQRTAELAEMRARARRLIDEKRKLLDLGE